MEQPRRALLDCSDSITTTSMTASELDPDMFLDPECLDPSGGPHQNKEQPYYQRETYKIKITNVDKVHVPSPESVSFTTERSDVELGDIGGPVAIHVHNSYFGPSIHLDLKRLVGLDVSSLVRDVGKIQAGQGPVAGIVLEDEDPRPRGSRCNSMPDLQEIVKKAEENIRGQQKTSARNILEALGKLKREASGESGRRTIEEEAKTKVQDGPRDNQLEASTLEPEIIKVDVDPSVGRARSFFKNYAGLLRLWLVFVSIVVVIGLIYLLIAKLYFI